MLTIINAYQNHPVICQQIFCQLQSWINHIQPIRMETTVAFGVLHHTVAIFIKLPTIGKVLIRTLSKVILIHKVVAGVVRRIYVPTDFDTKEKALSGAKAAEKGLK